MNARRCQQQATISGGVGVVEKTAPKVLIVGTFACIVVDPQSSYITGYHMAWGIRCLRDTLPHPCHRLIGKIGVTVLGDESDYVIGIVARVLLNERGSRGAYKVLRLTTFSKPMLPTQRIVGAELETSRCQFNQG